jgi:hypothetical protein
MSLNLNINRFDPIKGALDLVGRLKEEDKNFWLSSQESNEAPTKDKVNSVALRIIADLKTSTETILGWVKKYEVEPDLKDPEYFLSALTLSVIRGDESLVDHFLSKAPNPFENDFAAHQDAGGFYPHHYASILENNKILQKLCPPDQKAEDCFPTLQRLFTPPDDSVEPVFQFARESKLIHCSREFFKLYTATHFTDKMSCTRAQYQGIMLNRLKKRLGKRIDLAVQPPKDFLTKLDVALYLRKVGDNPTDAFTTVDRDPNTVLFIVAGEVVHYNGPLNDPSWPDCSISVSKHANFVAAIPDGFPNVGTVSITLNSLRSSKAYLRDKVHAIALVALDHLEAKTTPLWMDKGNRHEDKKKCKFPNFEAMERFFNGNDQQDRILKNLAQRTIGNEISKIIYVFHTPSAWIWLISNGFIDSKFLESCFEQEIVKNHLSDIAKDDFKEYHRTGANRLQTYLNQFTDDLRKQAGDQIINLLRNYSPILVLNFLKFGLLLSKNSIPSEDALKAELEKIKNNIKAEYHKLELKRLTGLSSSSSSNPNSII